MKGNPLLRTTIVWGFITILGIFGIFAPSIFGMEGFSGGFAISLICVLLAITALIATFIYLRLAWTLDGMLKGENVLAHWKYSPEEWKKYTEKEFTEDKDSKRILVIIVAIFALIAGIAVYVYDPENGKFVLLVMVGLIVLIGLVAVLSVKYDHYQNRKYLGESYITQDGVYLNRRLHLWRGLGSQLDRVSYEDEDSGQPILKFEYSTFGWQMRNYYIARVPVPNGQQEKAKQIAAEIASTHLQNEIR